MKDVFDHEPSSHRNLAVAPGNYYELLDVSPSASRLEIRESYIRLRSTYSTRSHALYSIFSEEDARESLQALEEAYRVLDDDMLRKEYDKSQKKLSGQAAFGLDADSVAGSSQPGHDSWSLCDPGHTMASPHEESRLSNDDSLDAWGDANTEPVTQTPSYSRPSANKKRFAPFARQKEIQEELHLLIEECKVKDGAFLKQLREITGVSHEVIRDATKIPLHYMQSIETDDYDSLPAPVYIRGFLKSYLEFLGLVKEAPGLVSEYTENLKKCHKS